MDAVHEPVLYSKVYLVLKPFEIIQLGLG